MEFLLLFFVDLAASARLIHQLAFRSSIPTESPSLILRRDGTFVFAVSSGWRGAYYLMADGWGPTSPLIRPFAK